MAENGPHWPTVDFATLTSGAVLVPIYPTVLPEQAAYIARDCGAKVVFAETTHHLEGLLAHASELPEVQHFVLIRGDSDDGGRRKCWNASAWLIASTTGRTNCRAANNSASPSHVLW